ncbi:MAG TPA: hypothetical protein VND22_04975 [Actinomycetota bacterium]|nr:hypothetical protein [Actinomycetota bacterium]
MDPWNAWELGRATLALCAVMYAGIWIQVSLFHRAGGFSHRSMYLPVIYTPLAIAGALAGIVRRDGWWGWISLGLLGLAVLFGVVGLVLHWKAILSHIGGLTMRNLIAGPPPILPLTYSLIGLVGITGLLSYG